MSKRIFTQDEIMELRKNPNVSSCSSKSITYASAFKIKAVELCLNQYLNPRDVFTDAGFDLRVIGWDTPRDCLQRWGKTLHNKGVEALKKESRGRNGGGPKSKFQTDKEKLLYLETKVKYLEAENHFLAELRKAKRAE
jgi:hypothetical protein